MVNESMYPQRWLPYHYLSPFVFDRWDAEKALREEEGTMLGRTPVLFLSSEEDTLVKPSMVKGMAEIRGWREGEREGGKLLGDDGDERDAGGLGSEARGKGARTRWVMIKGVHHDNAWTAKKQWGDAVTQFMEDVEEDKKT
jgi:hypothetical protein